ncbi:hypothetical protein LXL04_005423 [Taraxacum kok-saghyz]
MSGSFVPSENPITGDTQQPPQPSYEAFATTNAQVAATTDVEVDAEVQATAVDTATEVLAAPERRRIPKKQKFKPKEIIYAGLFGTRFLPAHSTSEAKLHISRNYRVLACAFLPKPGQSARLSRFGHFRGKTRQNIKHTGDILHDTRSTIKIVALNLNPSRRYDFRNMTYKHRTKMAISAKPGLQITNGQKFCKPNS